jgi:hypothetical protein
VTLLALRHIPTGRQRQPCGCTPTAQSTHLRVSIHSNLFHSRPISSPSQSLSSSSHSPNPAAAAAADAEYRSFSSTSFPSSAHPAHPFQILSLSTLSLDFILVVIHSEQTPTRPEADLVSRLKEVPFLLIPIRIWSPKQSRRRSIEYHTSLRTGLGLKRLCIAFPPSSLALSSPSPVQTNPTLRDQPNTIHSFTIPFFSQFPFSFRPHLHLLYNTLRLFLGPRSKRMFVHI